MANIADIPLRRVHSTGVRKLGFDPETRMVAVVYPDRDTVYGYPNLSEDEIRLLAATLADEEASLGHVISTVIKKNHDHEHVRWEPVYSP